MRLSEAQQKVERIVRTIEQGKVPYRVVQAVLYGSAAKGEENPQDVDIYLQLDWSSVPEEDWWPEVTGRSGGIVTKLHKALKKDNAERVSIQWSNEPWEEYRMKFVKPDEIEARLKNRMSELDLTRKSHVVAKRRMEKSVEKRTVKPTEWPPFGIVVYPRQKPG